MGFLDAGPGAVSALRGHATVETGEGVRAEALAALDAHRRGFREEQLLRQGEECLHLRLRVSPGLDPDGALLDVLYADGRWLRIRPLPDGSLLLADLEPGSIEIRVVGSGDLY
jgi:hypothetical protein